MKQRQLFEVKPLLFERVLPTDEAAQIGNDAAVSFAEFKYRTFPSLDKAQDAISMNVFYDPQSSFTYVQSKNSLSSKRLIGERVVGVFITESRSVSQILSVKLSLFIIRKSMNNTGSTEIVFTSEVELTSLKGGEAVAIPFFVLLENSSYE